MFIPVAGYCEAENKFHLVEGTREKYINIDIKDYLFGKEGSFMMPQKRQEVQWSQTSQGEGRDPVASQSPESELDGGQRPVLACVNELEGW